MTEERLRTVLTGLVDKGELTEAQAAAVIDGYLAEVPGGAPETSPTRGRRKWLGEIGGYVGGAFTLAAGMILLAKTWSSISHAGKIGILSALAAILFGVGVLIGGIRRSDASRRLAGTLVVFGSISAASASGVAAQHTRTFFFAAWAGLLVSALGYWRVKSAATHGALFAFSLLTMGAVFDLAHSHDGAAAIGFFAVAVAWLILATRGLLRERLFGLSLSSGAMVVAAEFSYGNGSRPVAYLLLAATSIIGFRIYIKSGEWPPLAGAVLATTVGVGEVVGSSLGGALGAAIGLLTAGLALLASSAWLLRRRR